LVENGVLRQYLDPREIKLEEIGENCLMKKIVNRNLLSRYFQNGQVKENEINRASSTNI
jgi:hypothetical protein